MNLGEEVTGGLLLDVNTAEAEPTDEAESSTLLGFRVLHLLVFFSICLILWVFMAVCWNCCTQTKQDQDQDSEHRTDILVATEVRPGLLLVQGYPTREDTYRIIQEYDSMRGVKAQYHALTPSGDGSEGAVSSPFSRVYQQTASAPDEEHVGLLRPPPYVPR